MHRVIFYQLDYSIKLNASGKNINFDENRVNKSDFYKNKKLFNIDDIECKYTIKKNKMENLINDDLNLSSSNNETDNESDHESDNESHNWIW